MFFIHFENRVIFPTITYAIPGAQPSTGLPGGGNLSPHHRLLVLRKQRGLFPIRLSLLLLLLLLRTGTTKPGRPLHEIARIRLVVRPFLLVLGTSPSAYRVRLMVMMEAVAIVALVAEDFFLFEALIIGRRRFDHDAAWQMDVRLVGAPGARVHGVEDVRGQADGGG